MLAGCGSFAPESRSGSLGGGVEAGLAEQIIARLGASKSGVIELTYLQVLLDKLYVRSAGAAPVAEPDTPGVLADNRGGITLTLRDLEALGELGDILGAFLNEQLAALPHEKAALGEAILKTLVTLEGTKKSLNAPEIAAALSSLGQKGDPAAIAALLNHFVAVRILSEKEASDRYELRHDSLAAKIFERMTALEKDLLEVMQMLENRCSEYRKRGALLDGAALNYIAPYKNRLHFKPEFIGFIYHSRSELHRIRRRRRIVLSAALLAVFLVVSGLGIVSYLKYREAEEQRTRAEQQTQIAREQQQQAENARTEAEQQRVRAEQQKERFLAVSNILTYDLVDGLNQIPGTKKILTTILQKNAAELEKLYAASPDDSRAQREQAMNLVRLGDMWMVLGDTQAALTVYRQSLEIRQRLARDTHNRLAHDDLVVACLKLGFVLWKQGKLDAAADAHADGLKVNPNNIGLLSNDTELAFVQGDLARCQIRIATALPLVKSDNSYFVILPFYAYLANSEQGWENVLKAIMELKAEVKFTWDFSATVVALDRLDAKTQQAARQFIAFFEGKIDLPTLKTRLEGR